MPATIAAPAGAAPAASSTSTAPVQTSAGGAPASADAGKIAGGGAPSPAKPGEAKPVEAPKPQRFKAKAKFDGKEQELDLDEGEVVREIQKARHYDRTRKDFDQQRQDFEQQLEAIKADPIDFLSKRGVDLRQLAVEQSTREAELAKLSPEARRAAELEQQLESMKSAETKRVEAEQQATAQREHLQLVQTTVRTIDGAIKLSGQKRSGELVKLYAEVMELAEHAGEPPLSTEQLVAAGEKLEVKRLSSGLKRAATDPAWRARNGGMMKELAQAILPALDGQELIDFVGKDNAVKLARAQLQVYRKNPLPTVAESTPGEKPLPPAPKTVEPQSMHAMLDQLAGR